MAETVVIDYRNNKKLGKVELKVDMNDGDESHWADAAIVCTEFPAAVCEHAQTTFQRFKAGELKCTKGHPATMLVEYLKSKHGKLVECSATVDGKTVVEKKLFLFADDCKIKLEKLAEAEKEAMEVAEVVPEEEVSRRVLLFSLNRGVSPFCFGSVLPIANAMNQEKCTDDFHKDLEGNMVAVYDALYLRKGGILFGRACIDCSKKFVTSSKNLQKDEFCPNSKNFKAARYCKNCHRNNCNLMLCHDCFGIRVGKCDQP